MSMARYHINPATGNPGICRARKSCPFGDLDTEHYSSKNEARRAYEKKMNLKKVSESRRLRIEQGKKITVTPEEARLSSATSGRLEAKDHTLQTAEAKPWDELTDEEFAT